jgi:radical S-adenosyl methionine domain-containing protein 2
MKCKFCYATFADIHEKRLSVEKDRALIMQLAEAQLFRKINFAGGEPTLLPHLKELIYLAKSLGFENSIVTNGSKIDAAWIADLAGVLDIISLSVDSADSQTNIDSGRAIKGKTLANQHLQNLADAAHQAGMYFKINTVVSRFNQQENLSPFINQLAPHRWKVLQVSNVEGQNDKEFSDLSITADHFDFFCQSNSQHLHKAIKFVPESCELIQGSYLMIDQLGRFYDSAGGKHNYSKPILEVGVQAALQNINTDFNKFLHRGGLYETKAGAQLLAQR